MSCCGVLWTAYLSYASTVAVGEDTAGSSSSSGAKKACCKTK
jgi:hypothetical protein